MAQNESQADGLSNESLEFLEDVKKGKPRRFAMICKGTNIVSLVVFKKGSLEKYKKEAKAVGKGQFYFGVVDGRGQDISFKLARQDGFDSPPTKTQSLKSFLDEGGLKCKPLFEIVDSAPNVFDEDDPLVVRFLRLQESALQARDDHPDRASEITSLVTQAASLLSEGESDSAEPQVAALESLLNSLSTEASHQSLPTSASTPPSAPPVPPSTASPTADATNEALRVKLLATLNKLVPQLKQAVAANPQRKQELLAPVANIKRQIEQGDLESAKQGLLTVGKLLKELLQINAGSDQQSQPSGGESTSNDSSRSETAPLVAKGTVDFAKCRLAWDATKKKVQVDLQKLEAAILGAFQSSPAIGELTAKIRKLDTVLESFAEDLSDILDRAYSASDITERTRHHQLAAQVVDRFLAHATNDTFISELQGNPFVPIEIQTTLVSTLGVLAKRLA